MLKSAAVVGIEDDVKIIVIHESAKKRFFWVLGIGSETAVIDACIGIGGRPGQSAAENTPR